MSNIITDKDDLAEVIRTMPFRDLMGVATELVRMNEDPDCARDISTPLGMAETLTDWADSQQD